MWAKMKRVDHVGIIVDDLAQAKDFATNVLGLVLDREFSLPEQSVLAAFFTVGDTRVELIEVTDPSLRAQRLGNGNQARIEHVAIEVDDLEATINALREKGVRTLTPEPWIVGSNRNLFTDPDTSDGVKYQLFDRRAHT
jgi:methylmalonyl-CoA/ethylmalonyl-CoA epimerase